MKKEQVKRGRPAEPEARFRRLADELRQRIQTGDFPPETVLPSIRSLAKRFGQSKGVVKLALDQLKAEGLVGATLRRRLAVLGVKNVTRARQAWILQVCTVPMRKLFQNRSFQRELQDGVEQGIGQLEAPLLIQHSHLWSDAVPGGLMAWPLRGVVLWGQFVPEVLARYAALPVPVVRLDHAAPLPEVHTVCADGRAEGRLAAEHLAAAGHRRIAVLRRVHLYQGKVDPDSVLRQAGFEEALAERGLRPKNEAVFNYTERDNRVASAVYRAILEAKPPFSAVFATDMKSARMLVNAARARGLTVPRDLSLVSVQGEAYAQQAISGARTDFFEMGRAAVRLLDGPKTPAQHVRMPARWHDGATLAPPRKQS